MTDLVVRLPDELAVDPRVSGLLQTEVLAGGCALNWRDAPPWMN